MDLIQEYKDSVSTANSRALAQLKVKTSELTSQNTMITKQINELQQQNTIFTYSFVGIILVITFLSVSIVLLYKKRNTKVKPKKVNKGEII